MRINKLIFFFLYALYIHLIFTQPITSKQSSLSNFKAVDQPSIKIIHTPTSIQESPKITISLNTNSIMKDLVDFSDSSSVAFLTATTQIPQSDKRLLRIGQFLIKKLNITQSMCIVFVNEIKYGIRVVLEIKNDHKLFEAVVTSDNHQAELLDWRRISKVSDINPQVFSQYYKISPDNDLKRLLMQSFESANFTNKFKEVSSAEKKITFDGVYYRVFIKSVSGHEFLIIFYSIPETKYTEILRYQLVNHGFDSSQENILNKVPYQNSEFDKVMKFISSRYQLVLDGSSIAYLSISKGKKGVYYRIVFYNINQKYQVIVLDDFSAANLVIVRWEKLQDGYVPIEISTFQKNDQFKSIQSGLKDFLTKKLKVNPIPDYLSWKLIPNYCRFYKFIFTFPFPFVVTLEQRLSDHRLQVRGIQKIYITPTNQYYNDRLFFGFGYVKPSQLELDPIFQVMNVKLKNNPLVKQKKFTVISAFSAKTANSIKYKSIYSIDSIEYIAQFQYEYASDQYKINSFDIFKRTIQQGDYRWKCLTVNNISKTCSTCDNTSLQTLGRCYMKLDGCILQIASSCYSCSPGYIRSSHSCFKEPEKNQAKILQTERAGEENCLLYNKEKACLKCSNRYYISNGMCEKIQDECKIYTSKGRCNQCFNGYYLNEGVCIALDPLCAQASNGFCIKCYKNYKNIEGKCYIQSNFDYFNQSIPKDQLCIQWRGSQCILCQIGTYLSKKLGKCQIKDPFCQNFNETKQQCEICYRGYRKIGSLCKKNF